MKLLRRLPRFQRAYRELARLAEREQWSRSEIECLQLERLNTIWRHAVEHVPYYRNLRGAAGLPRRFASLTDYRERMPMLRRECVQANAASLLSERTTPGSYHISGGSTGMPTRFFWPHAGHREVLCAKYRLHATWGIDILDRFVFLWGHMAAFAPGLAGLVARAAQPVADRLRNRKRLSAYRLGSTELREHLRVIESYRPAALYGYSGALYLLAQQALERGSAATSVRAVILTAEPSFDFMTSAVKRAFRAPTVIEYGSAECQLIAGQSPDGALRVRDDIVFVETIPRNDGRYDIVLTVLANPAFPLLRYRIGDVTDSPLKTPDRGFSILGNVLGRRNDFVRSRSGNLIHPTLLMALITSTDGVRRYQVRQSVDGAVRVTLEPHDGRSAIDVKRVQRYVQDAVEGYPVSVALTGRLRANAAGKHRWIVSELSERTDSQALAKLAPVSLPV